MEVQEARLHKFLEGITEAVPSWDPVVLECHMRKLVLDTPEGSVVRYGLTRGRFVTY